jgi:anti-sigma regulatory factor (Ser/Thr protein kinase)
VSQLRCGNDLCRSEAIAVTVTESSQVGEARRAATQLAGRLGFGEAEAGKVAVVVTEAASNLVKHGGGGELLLGALERDGVAGIEILALDRGPGMADLGRCLRDGFSTTGTRGTGLGAIVRLSSGFDVHSASNAGTAVLARMWARSPEPDDPGVGVEVGVVSRPHPAEQVCGDAWAVEQAAGRVQFVVADGLGHGPAAAAAAREAVRIFRDNVRRSPAEILQSIDAALRSTRGAALLVVQIDLADRQVCCTGVGNISGSIISAGASRSLVSHNGTVGHSVRKVQEFLYPFPRGSLLVLHSDGLATSWRLDQYPGLAVRTPLLIAGVLYRDFKRGRDDVTVLAARERSEGGGCLDQS